MSNCRVIALTNQKGGVGKTTTTVNLGAGLARQGNRVLLIDADSQANLTMSLGWDKPDELAVTLPTVMQSIVEELPFDVYEGILHHEEGVDLLPSSIELSGLDMQLLTTINRENILKTYVNQVRREYDYILIDCMPSLGISVVNALSTADSLIIPTQAHYLSAKGLELLLKNVKKVKRHINPNLQIDGILITMAQAHTLFSQEIVDVIQNAYGQNIRVFDTQIPHSIRAAEASAAGKSIFAYDKRCKAAEAYERFTREVIHIERQRQTKSKSDRIR